MALKDELSPLLPQSDTLYNVLNVASVSKQSKRIFYSEEPQRTIKTQHFITISQGLTVIYGIEIYVYVVLLEDRTERLMFISKADTSGLFNSSLSNGIKINISAITKLIMEYLLKIPLSFYLDQVLLLNDTQNSQGTDLTQIQRNLDILIKRWRLSKSLTTPSPEETPRYSLTLVSHNGKIIDKIFMFTRPEAQYLFPYSKKNPGKHLLSGDQLLKWWCRIVDSVVNDCFLSAEKKLLVPGAESRTVKRYFPSPDWQEGEIFSNDNSDLAIHRIPILPDDPKGRFIEHLIVENRIQKVRMRQFWLELSVRQEFRLGIVVGVVGVKGEYKGTRDAGCDISRVRMRKLKKIKGYVIEEDYSHPEALQSYSDIYKMNPQFFTEVRGDYREQERQKSAVVAELRPMMVIKRKKKPLA